MLFRQAPRRLAKPGMRGGLGSRGRR